jgi:uncharacterized protein YjbI with pentapeptide repeats
VRNVSVAGCGADMAAFRACLLEQVDLEATSLREADFAGATLEDVSFAGCDLTGASFDRVRCARVDFRRCRMEAVQGLAHLRGAAMDVELVMGLAPALADALGITLLDD